MQKQIKDYLHLYIGCRIKTKHGFTTLDEIGSDGINLTHENPMYFDEEEIKPFLRPLSSMVTLESDVYGHIYYNEQFVFGNRRICMHAQAAAYLLSKHFDLFGLIEAGLAIDATTINQPTT